MLRTTTRCKLYSRCQSWPVIGPSTQVCNSSTRAFIRTLSRTTRRSNNLSTSINFSSAVNLKEDGVAVRSCRPEIFLTSAPPSTQVDHLNSSSSILTSSPTYSLINSTSNSSFRIAKKSKSFSYNLSRKFTTLSATDKEIGDILLNQERFPLTARTFSPAVMRAFFDFKAEDTKLAALNEMHQNAETVLNYLEKRQHQAHRNKKDATNSSDTFPSHIEKLRRSAGDSMSDLANSITTNNELSILAACLTILIPRSEGAWLSFDKTINLRAKEFSLQPLLLCSHALISATRNLKMGIKFRTPQSVGELILQKDTVLSEPYGGERTIFASIGSPQCEASYPIELLGLQLETLSVKTDYLRYQQRRGLKDHFSYKSKDPESNGNELAKISSHCFDTIAGNPNWTLL
jgi:hypothetical protein